MDRECIVDNAADATRGLRPTIRPGILIEPLLHPIESLAETSIRYGDPDPVKPLAPDALT
jgi:hypothetical protein